MKFAAAAIALSLSVCAAQAADTALLDRHVANMKSGNVDGIVADYAPHAVIVTPAGMVSPRPTNTPVSCCMRAAACSSRE